MTARSRITALRLYPVTLSGQPVGAGVPVELSEGLTGRYDIVSAYG